MADREQLYTALRNADAAGDTAAAQRLTAYIRTLPADAPTAKTGITERDQLPKIATPYDPRMKPAQQAESLPLFRPISEIKSNLSNIALGTGVGAAGIGNNILKAATYPMSKLNDAARAVLPDGAKRVIPDISQWNRTRDADMQYINDQVAGNTPLQFGKLATEVGATWPVGGALGKGAGMIASLPKLAAIAPKAAPLIKAIETGGFKTGADLAGASKVAKLVDLGTRAAGGAITGGASAALVAPEHAGMGAAIGAALPPALKVLGGAAGYAGKAAKSVVQPFTEAGQKDIAGSIIRKFADGGPMNINTTQLVPGSLPTLAEATGNAGIAGLQRGARDISPNAFVAREQGNAAARSNAFDDAAGNVAALDTATAARDQTANALYGRAFAADTMRRGLSQAAQEARAPFAGVGLSGKADDLATPGLRELASRPMFKQAVDDARKLAANKGVTLADPLQSLEGLHYIKLALDDALNPAAKSAMGRNASSAVMSMRDKLAAELASVSPLYGNARGTYAEMSRPIDAMEALQGLKITNSTDQFTLQKIKTATEQLEKAQRKAGVNSAKSVDAEQMSTLNAIHDDLRRQSNLGLGRSAGSNTFQNIATDNIVSSFLPGALGNFVKGKAGGLLGQAGKLVYSGPNESIRGQLVDMMLDPALAQGALSGQKALTNQNALTRFLQSQKVQQPMYRVAPLLGSDL